MPIGNAEDETGSSYSLSLYDEATVIAGSDKASAYNHYTPYRVDACQNRDYNYVLIERCTHDDHIYEYKDTTTHFAHCKYCFHSDTEEHEVVDGVCIKCEFVGYDVHILSENGSGEEDHDHIDAGNGVNLRKADAIEPGTFFRGSFLCLRSSLKKHHSGPLFQDQITYNEKERNPSGGPSCRFTALFSCSPLSSSSIWSSLRSSRSCSASPDSTGKKPASRSSLC